MTKTARSLICAGIALCSPLAAHAATITDRDRVFGDDAIDPAGSETVDTLPTGSGFVSQSVLEAVSSFGAIQDVSGLAAGTNTFAYTTLALPDVQISVSGAGSTAGDDFSNAGFATSGTSAIRTNVSASAGTSVTTIDFGDATGTFNPDANAVIGAGFTLVNLRTGNTVTVDFLNGAGAVLSSQVAAVTSDTDPDVGGTQGLDVYFGYLGDGSLAQGVSQITITRVATASGDITAGLDDIGFTAVVPEPASATVLALAGATLVARRRGRGR